ncbi:hypothetical protein QJQ45_024378 [Haematococcus lacustris]|nr:hypothetical protein QJQ45_024378 [Haematococcus lacustris]
MCKCSPRLQRMQRRLFPGLLGLQACLRAPPNHWKEAQPPTARSLEPATNSKELRASHQQQGAWSQEVQPGAKKYSQGKQLGRAARSSEEQSGEIGSGSNERQR